MYDMCVHIYVCMCYKINTYIYIYMHTCNSNRSLSLHYSILPYLLTTIRVLSENKVDPRGFEVLV